MSANILEQAIIDAKALREAALKNAETSILEKYSAEVRGAIDVMLEAEMEDESLTEQEMVSPEEEMASAPLAAAEGEDLCGCPDQGEEVEWELSLDDLRAMSDDMGEVPMTQDELAVDFGAEEEEDEMFLQESEELDEEIDLVFEDEEKEEEGGEPTGEAGSSRKRSMRDRYSNQKSPRALEEKEEEDKKPDFLDLDKDGDKDEPMSTAAKDRKGRMRSRHSQSSGSIRGVTRESKDEEIDLDEDMVREIVEELVVDIAPTKSGWAGTPEPIVRHQEDQELARLQGTEAKEENDALVAANKELSEAKKAVATENEKLKQLIYDLDGKLKESILSNAKLLYTNQTLTSASLNERQKNRIVESIRDADSVEEAKVIFETLQSAAGPSLRKPKSLSEVISRPTLQVSRRRNENKGRESVAKNRFQKLAGIKNNK
jgi:hypothetical protein